MCRTTRVVACFAWLLAWPSVTCVIGLAEQLPIRTYTTTDGLAQDNINRIVPDSKGFLWFCTGEGLSCFDGYQFTSYTSDQGLPDRRVKDFLQTRAGDYWVATGNGICRFDPSGAVPFTPYQSGLTDGSQVVEVMLEDHDGAIWFGTHSGLYRLETKTGHVKIQSVDIGMPPDAEGNVVQALLLDRQGSLWSGTLGGGLYRRWPDGRVERYTTRNGLPRDRIEALLEDRSGQIWAGTSLGLAQLVSAPDPSRPVVSHVFRTGDGLAGDFVESLFQSADGRLWAGGGGLSEYVPGESAEPGKSGMSHRGNESRTQHFRAYTTAQGLSSAFVQALAEDRDGNLWLGTD
ncbi:MAG: ligand-binding sensor domain-containing protein, partial [Blastocatellia bacterium]